MATCLVVGLASLLAACAPTTASLSRRPEARPELMTKDRLNSMERYLDEIAAAPDSDAAKKAGGRFVEWWRQRNLPPTTRIGTWNVRFTGDYGAAYFDKLLPAADYEVNGLNHRYTRDGRGVAMIGCRHNSGREAIEAYYPPELITRPVTALFKAGPGRTMTITLADPLRHPDVAADFSAPLANLLGHTGALGRMGFGGLLGSGRAQHRGHVLYLMEPYDPRKTPVLFVHGLLSTPLAWANVTNELWGDPDFRSRYQIWHYLYPTSAPFLYSAKMFRQRINEVRTILDPQQRHPASRQLDIVAHSMGGLLTRTLITDSGDTAWNTVFRVPPESLHASEVDRREVSDILHWKARRDVRQVIFIAVPHRGSDMSQNWIGRIGDSLAGLPVNFTSLYARLHQANPEALQPAFRKALSRGELTSIDTLSPKHPLLEPLNALPFAPWITTHSIIGNRGRNVPLASSSDGVVPYASSHLETAASELIVPTGHGAYKDPRAVEEILRILKEAAHR